MSFMNQTMLYTQGDACKDHSDQARAGVKREGELRRRLRKTLQRNNWVVVANIFHFHPYLGKIPILTNMFSKGLKPPTRTDLLSRKKGVFLQLIINHCCSFIRSCFKPWFFLGSPSIFQGHDFKKIWVDSRLVFESP